jgi:3-phosphoshikimate 1-carboxyvinyltransferase
LEPEATRDHTERMLAHFGLPPAIGEEAGVRTIALEGGQPLRPAPVKVPGDPSSAAFPAVAALLVPGSRLRIEGVLVNPLRTGLFQTLRDMGARLAFENERIEAGEPVADLAIEAGPLRGVEVPPERAPSMIDEYPVLSVAAACAEGRTVMRGLAELRVKESDRLAATAAGLKACGIQVEELEDGLIVEGRPGAVPGGGTVESRMDHRMAMAFLVLGLAAQKPVTVDDSRMIDTSFPGFSVLMGRLGASVGAP